MYFGTSINESPVIAGKAAAAITDGAMRAVIIDADGVKVAGAGKEAMGILIAETEPSVAVGDTVTIQIKDGGLWKTGAAVAPGDLLAADADGKAVKATTGAYVLAQALDAATAADQVIHVQVIKAGYSK